MSELLQNLMQNHEINNEATMVRGADMCNLLTHFHSLAISSTRQVQADFEKVSVKELEEKYEHLLNQNL